jgi:3-hydroxybutyryl-CoA dehydrogenase
MGTGIAHAFLVAGSRVALVDVGEDVLPRSVERLRTLLQQTHYRGQLDGAPDQVERRLQVGTDLAAVAASALVVEAVPEVPAVKIGVLGAVEAVVAADTVLATNTSSISVGELGQVLEHPERFLGLHFFNPVPASLMVEVVVGPCTAPEFRDRAVTSVQLIGKEPVLVRDAPGFASSRLGVMLGLEAIRMVEEGVATPEDIDKAMTLGYKHPIGPLHLTDLVGLDVRLAIADYLSVALGPRFAPPTLLRTMVEQGYVGRKSGRGFFSYE